MDAVTFWCDERGMVARRHLARLAERLPAGASDLRPATDASDAVILHLWMAAQVMIDLAVSACLHWDLGAPPSYAEVFRRLARAGVIEQGLAHAYDQRVMGRVYRAASDGPRDLEAFLAALRDRL